ncbi:MAG: hypothetical protein NC311_11530 [Muribaculaceae bacterium]|nr:hypothetical protein [Muribaculaceae bacterium]
MVWIVTLFVVVLVSGMIYDIKNLPDRDFDSEIEEKTEEYRKLPFSFERQESFRKEIHQIYDEKKLAEEKSGRFGIYLLMTVCAAIIVTIAGFFWYYFCAGFLLFEDISFGDKILYGITSLFLFVIFGGGLAALFAK